MAHNHYIDAHKRFEQSLNGKSKTPVHALRSEAISQFAELGFPTTRDEDWSHTNVASISRVPYRLVDGPASGVPSPDPIPSLAFTEQESGAARLVFVNGHFSAECSRIGALPEGVRIGSLASSLESGDDLVHDQLGKHASFGEHPFAALNTAFIADGAVIYVPDGVALETAVHVVYCSTSADDPTVSHPRTLVLIGDNSQATVVETYTGEGVYFTNAVTEIVAGENGVVDHYKLGFESPESHHVATTQTRQGRDSRISTHSISLGGTLVRNDINALLAGEGSDAIVNGLYMLSDGQHVDNHTLIEHAEPNCASHELYKGILGGSSHGVFRGKIFVHQKAQKTDAYQSNQNLLLSPDANINTKPQLEIYADDVKCSHGATIGQMDEGAMFYLRARGIGRELAQQILVHAFADDILDRVKADPVRSALAERVERKFAQARQIGTTT